jgi:hypothetical protein
MNKKAAAFIVVAGGLCLGAAGLHAKREEPPSLVQYQAGQSWSFEDTLRAQIPDPQTGLPLTPTTRGVFRYRVERELSDHSVVLAAKVVSLKAGSSEKRLETVPVEHPDRPEQLMIASVGGEVYGPFADADRKKALRQAADLDAFFGGEDRPAPLVSYKLPIKKLRVGKTATRSFGSENWTVRRLEDEDIGGVTCRVYEAELEGGLAIKVVETIWFDQEKGVPLRRKIVEKRAKNVSSTLTQVRL